MLTEAKLAIAGNLFEKAREHHRFGRFGWSKFYAALAWKLIRSTDPNLGWESRKLPMDKRIALGIVLAIEHNCLSYSPDHDPIFIEAATGRMLDEEGEYLCDQNGWYREYYPEKGYR